MDASDYGSAGNEAVSGSAPRGERLDRALARTSDAPLREGNRLELLKNGPSTYDDWLAAIRRSRGWVHLDNYIFQDDTTGKRFAEALAAKAAEGVRVNCIIFNYNRINAGLDNPIVREHMDAFFHRISHHLLFVSKDFRGYHIMKEIVAKDSSSAPQGVPSFEYNPRDYVLQPFELVLPLDELEAQLLNDFAGRTLTMNEIYEEHSVGKPFLKNNYKQALWNLLPRGEIGASTKPRKNTFADHISASFPPA